MSKHDTDFKGDVHEALRTSVLAKIPDAVVEVTGVHGHYSLTVTSPVFAGKSMVDQQRLVYGAIAHLMKGDLAPVHAVDQLVIRVP